MLDCPKPKNYRKEWNVDRLCAVIAEFEAAIAKHGVDMTEYHEADELIAMLVDRVRAQPERGDAVAPYAFEFDQLMTDSMGGWARVIDKVTPTYAQIKNVRPLYTAPPADARDARALLRQAIDAMSKLRQRLEFPGRNGGLYVFPEEAVKKFTDEQARLMYEERHLASDAQMSVTDAARLEFVMRIFPGSAARTAGIVWEANTIGDYRAAIDRAMGGE